MVKKTSDELLEALRELDLELGSRGLSIEIRAMGGFALLVHGIRKGHRAYTADIDTVTPNYPAQVQSLIAKVGARLGLDPDWLNNYNVMDDAEHVEMLIQAEWEPMVLAGAPLRAIKLSVASMATLTRAKRLAAEDAQLSGRAQDAPDLVELVARQGITSINQYDARFPDEWGEFPASRAIVARYLASMKQEPGNASSQESPGFSRGEEVKKVQTGSAGPGSLLKA